jgi:hypothetical protein
VAAICERDVALALAETELSAVWQFGIDGTSQTGGHEYIRLPAAAAERRVLVLVEGR